MARQRPARKVASQTRPRAKRKAAHEARRPAHDEVARGPRRAVAAVAQAVPGAPVVELMARRALLAAARQVLRHHVDRCTKCGSTYVSHEPAFVHCHYCGRLHRVANASLLAQELFELRSGMRLAS